MKIYKYQIAYEVNIGTETEPVYKTFYTEKSTTNEEIAKREAYKGEYTIDDDGQPEPISTITTEERVEALEAAVTMLCMPDVSEV